jgi:hypothetical protein
MFQASSVYCNTHLFFTIASTLSIVLSINLSKSFAFCLPFTVGFIDFWIYCSASFLSSLLEDIFGCAKYLVNTHHTAHNHAHNANSFHVGASHEDPADEIAVPSTHSVAHIKPAHNGEALAYIGAVTHAIGAVKAIVLAISQTTSHAFVALLLALSSHKSGVLMSVCSLPLNIVQLSISLCTCS